MRRRVRWIAAAVIVATGCGRGAARGPAAPAPLPVPAHLAGLVAGDRALTYVAVHGEVSYDSERDVFEIDQIRLRCAQEVAVVAEFHAARITCEVEARPRVGDGDAGPWVSIEQDVEGRYVTDGVGLWRDAGTAPWPPPLDELRALVQTPALIAHVPVPGRDEQPTDADEARGYYHVAYPDPRDDRGGLCGADVSTGRAASVIAWCVGGARGLHRVHRGFDGSQPRDAEATLRDD